MRRLEQLLRRHHLQATLVRSLLMGEVVLVVGGGDPAVVNCSEFGPGSGVGNPPVGHPLLHPEQRFPNPGTYPIACTVNADESIVVTVEG